MCILQTSLAGQLSKFGKCNLLPTEWWTQVTESYQKNVEEYKYDAAPDSDGTLAEW
jgi:hypothetical protein